ncbi:MAG: phytanoyl-CoA dioxygenase family protein [Ahrensia sp.]|nr:phytanoyl-CoA dioxygenase family protein [Ahrensia sp.]
MSLTTEAERQTFREDGVVALRGTFDLHWLDELREGIAADLANPTERLTHHNADPSKPAYIEDFWCWSDFAQFERFVHHSPCAPIAAELLDASRINLVMDNWFLREAGSTSRPPFHHDISYFDFTGSMCVLWLPLEAISAGSGIQFVRGSHLSNKLYRRVRFKDGHESGEPVVVNGLPYEPPPDIEADPDAFDLVEFDLEPGDCIYFDMRTLHGSLSTTTPKQNVHRYTLRMTAPDGRIRYRGDWAKEERALFEAQGYRDGDSIDGTFFPQLWPRP